MSAPQSRLDATLAAIDAANADDPRAASQTEDSDTAFEELYARAHERALYAVYPEASDLLQIAARAQHLRRWEISREDLSRRAPGLQRVAQDLPRASCGARGRDHAGPRLERGEAAHVGVLIRKEQLKKEPESQALENIAAIVFLEHYFDDFLAKYARLRR